MGDTAAQRRIVEDYVERFEQEHPLMAVFFFGSRAQGTFDEWSDFDLLIVSAAFEGLDFWERWRLASSYWTAKRGADFFCYTPDEYEEIKDEISVPGEAIRHGVRIV